MAVAVDPACVELGALLRETRTKHRPDIKPVKTFAHELRNVMQSAPTRDAVSNIETGHKWPAQRVVEGYEKLCDLPAGFLVKQLQRLHDKREPRRSEPHAVITSPSDRATACQTQIVKGQWSGHFGDHVLWVVVRPVVTDRYYRQLGPVTAGGDGVQGRGSVPPSSA